MKKYEREIRELLEKMESFVPENPTGEKERVRDREPERERESRKRSVGVMPPQPIPIRPRRSNTSNFSAWLNEHHVSVSLRWMLAGLGLVIVAMIIAENFGGLLWLAQLVGAIGGIVFLSPVLIRFFKGRDLDDGQQYWRGQAVGSDGFSWTNVKSWFRGRGRGNRRSNDPWNNRNRNNRW
ncbi:MAG TPA: hypothetical protein VH186_10040 [Chloroflexia bacterium]|nr:hypothetical protein [Chloroflexia bacterium]